MKSNICIIGLARDLTKQVAYQMSLQLDMFYADVNDLLQFELTNIDDVIAKCGTRYMEELERKKVRNVATFDNTVFTMSFATYQANAMDEKLRNHAITIFLDVPQQYYKIQENSSLYAINKLLNKDRRIICEKNCDITVRCRKIELDHIVKQLCFAIMKNMR